MSINNKTIDQSKIKLSITIDDNQFKKLSEYNLNKSKLINWILVNYFNESGGKNEK